MPAASPPPLSFSGRRSPDAGPNLRLQLPPGVGPVEVQIEYDVVHLRTSLVQLFALLQLNFEEVVQIIELRRFGSAPNGYPFAALGSCSPSGLLTRDPFYRGSGISAQARVADAPPQHSRFLHRRGSSFESKHQRAPSSCSRMRCVAIHRSPRGSTAPSTPSSMRALHTALCCGRCGNDHTTWLRDLRAHGAPPRRGRCSDALPCNSRPTRRSRRGQPSLCVAGQKAGSPPRASDEVLDSAPNPHPPP
jgi:hypothetical protein